MMGFGGIRVARDADRQAVFHVAEACGMFQIEEELRFLDDLFRRQFHDSAHERDKWVLCEPEREVIGVAYYAPERMASGTWNLYFIAVLPEDKGRGIGSALLGFVEDDLRSHGERMLLIQTSGLPAFDATRAFYRSRGYGQEAQVRDFYEAGNDQITFRKLLKD